MMADDDIDFGSLGSGVFNRLGSYLRPYAGGFVFAFGAMAGALLMDMVVPHLFGEVIQEAVSDGDEATRIERIQELALWLLGAKLLQLLTSWIGEVATARIGQAAIRDLRVELFRHVLAKPMAFFQRHPTGRLVTRVSFDLENISQMYTTGVVNGVIDVMLVVGFAVAMCLKDLRLGLAAVLALPLFIAASMLFRRFARPVYLDERRLMARINAFLAENISGVREVKLAAAEAKQERTLRTLVVDHLRASLGMLRISSVFMPGMASMSYLVSLAILVWAAWLAVQGELELGTFVSFLMYLDYFFRPIREMGEKINIVQIAAASAERIFKLLDDDEGLDASREGRQPDSVKGRVTFDNVTFGYDPQRPVLKDLSFTVEPGEVVAFVGATGAGKSSCLKLLSRFHDVQSGAVCIDGIDVRDWDRSALRRWVGTVSQDVHLFSGTLRDNVTLGRDVSDEVVTAAAERSRLEPVIARHPEGWEMEVREGGRALSGGERQLVSFARVLVSDSRLVLLDEATSSLDVASERQVQEALNDVLAGRTCFLIAHRLSTVRRCDRIFVLSEGALVESGTHDTLVTAGGVYARLVRDQEQVDT